MNQGGRTRNVLGGKRTPGWVTDFKSGRGPDVKKGYRGGEKKVGEGERPIQKHLS